MSHYDSIPCYSESEWQAYATGDLPEEVRQVMEEHLLNCDGCLCVYLSKLEAQKSEEYTLGSDFTERIMNQVQRKEASPKPWAQVQKQHVSKDREKSGNRMTLFVSYCAAASIVFFLWTGGYIHGLSKTLNESVIKSDVSLINNGWTKNTNLEKRPSLIQHFLEKKE
ncbi:zf-HC2 domain-containing protein [Dehalobacter sp. DCM]|uniref:anti-sigma factor family protein n=1 Tax=Dehalobacter sp. DCM TaxID=2907827 RepID=UPI00308166CC|nr:zf-HC2 domain-containing protein [Dehalobacter sp. DCM]